MGELEYDTTLGISVQQNEHFENPSNDLIAVKPNLDIDELTDNDKRDADHFGKSFNFNDFYTTAPPSLTMPQQYAIVRDSISSTSLAKELGYG